MKTADEMFRELGYKKNREHVYRRFNPSGSFYEIRYDGMYFEKEYWCQDFGTVSYSLTVKETLACAQLIREMEEVSKDGKF